MYETEWNIVSKSQVEFSIYYRMKQSEDAMHQNIVVSQIHN